MIKAHRLVHHSPLGCRVIKKKKRVPSRGTARCQVEGVWLSKGVQGYLAHEKTPRPRNLQWDYSYGPKVVLGGEGYRVEVLGVAERERGRVAHPHWQTIHHPESAHHQLVTQNLLHTINSSPRICCAQSIHHPESAYHFL